MSSLKIDRAIKIILASALLRNIIYASLFMRELIKRVAVTVVFRISLIFELIIALDLSNN